LELDFRGRQQLLNFKSYIYKIIVHSKSMVSLTKRPR